MELVIPLRHEAILQFFSGETIMTFFNSAISGIYHFQTLISGVLAVLAAFGGGWAIYHSAQMPLEAQREQQDELKRRRLLFACRILASEFSRISTLARQAESTIQVTIASQVTINDSTRQKTTLPIPELLSDWEFMSLLPSELFDQVTRVTRAIQDHNFDMSRAGGLFGDNNFQRHVLAHASALIPMAHGLANSFIQQANAVERSKP